MGVQEILEQVLYEVDAQLTLKGGEDAGGFVRGHGQGVLVRQSAESHCKAIAQMLSECCGYVIKSLSFTFVKLYV